MAHSNECSNLTMLLVALQRTEKMYKGRGWSWTTWSLKTTRGAQAPWVDNVSHLSCASSQRRRKLVIDDDGFGIGLSGSASLKRCQSRGGSLRMCTVCEVEDESNPGQGRDWPKMFGDSEVVTTAM